MRVFLTGGSGFVGSAVLGALLGRGHEVTALVHRSEIERDGVTSVGGGLFDADLDAAMAGHDAIVHLVGIIEETGDATFERMHVEGTRRIVDAAVAAGVPRYVHMSALGSRADAVSAYHQTKWDAEMHVRKTATDMPWTIFRPSLIHGPAGEFTQQLVAWSKGTAAPWFFMPYFGAGLLGTGRKYRIAPVHIDDVAKVFADAVEDRKVAGKIYNVCGSERLTWPEMHRTASAAITGKPKRVIPIPAWYAKL
ncbi:MAG: NAD(P)H-binding protein, partial [Planctomycetota bacterium]